MDKSSGDQLNRAYDAYRQACMEKERYKKEKELYEQQSHEQQKQIASLKQRISVLTSQLALLAGADNNLPLESLEDQLRASLQRERHYEEQLEVQKQSVVEMEDEQYKLKSSLSSKNEEIQQLRSLLKEATERLGQPESRTIHGRETEMRSKKHIPDVSTATVAFDESERQSVERLFSDIKEKFSRIYKLTREQRSQLNTFLIKKGPTSEPLEQFSMPVQCTDEENQEAQLLTKESVKTVCSIMPITARGLAPDLDLSVSVESLSNFNVKFPPNHDESEFLTSSTENPPVLLPVLEQKKNLSKIDIEAPPFLRKYSTALSSPPYSPRSPKTGGHIDNGNLIELGPDQRDNFVAGCEDSSRFMAANSPVGKCTDAFCIPDVDDSVEVTGRTVRGPQQPIWRPSSPQDSDLSLDENSSYDVCQFCQAVFPPSLRTGEEFLRHLYTHFKRS